MSTTSMTRTSLAAPTADPGAIGLSLFGFALVMYGVQWVIYGPTPAGGLTSSVGTIYAVLAAGIGETLAGILYILRGQGYQASILCAFGLWLIGLYLLLSAGEHNPHFTPHAVGWYSLILFVPVAYMAIPSFQHRNIPFIVAFVALLALLVFLGLGMLAADPTAQPAVPPSATLLMISGWCAWVASVPLGLVAARITLNISKHHPATDEA